MTNPPPERWSHLGALFDAAAVLPERDQARFIEEKCGDDPALAAELRGLLAADASGAPDGWLQAVVMHAAAALAWDGATGREGQLLGPWRILAPLGEGGMGAVFHAERADGAYHSRAALKLVRGGLAGPALARRFRAERQILAGLRHPGIAQLLDGGTGGDGTPYLVMEYVEGEPVTRWADQQRLDVPARCRLILRVCDAVRHAHQQLVVHRDLKPGNILITASGAPKLLDFGIATLLDAVDRDSETGTTLAMQLMTPAYASPEQVRRERTGVATDVYALGVLLYELLTGRLPIDTAGLSPAELERRVTDTVPPSASSVAPPERRRFLLGDLDAILSRALRKAPGERYPSVEAFADDLERHLDGRPITVRRDDRAYRATRFLRRNASAVGAALAIVGLLAAIAVSSVRQARRIAVERDRAEAGQRSAEAVSAFLEDVFALSDPNEARGSSVTARALLDSGAARLGRNLADQPETRARMALTMARAYRNLGLVAQSRPLVDSAVAIRRRVLPGSHEDVAIAILEQAVQTYDEGDYEAALPLYQEAVQRLQAADSSERETLATALQGLATALDVLRQVASAESLFARVLAMRQRLHEPPHPALGLAYMEYASALRHAGRPDDALPHNREAVAQLRAAPDANPLELAQALNHLGSTLRELTRGEEALAPIEESIAIQERVHGAPHPETAAGLGNLAGVLQQLGRYEESEAARRRSLAIFTAVHGERHPYVAGTLQSLAGVLQSAGKLAESEQTYRRAVVLHRAAFPPDHPNLGFPLTGLGRVLLEQGRPAEALVPLREAYRVRRAGLPEGHWHVAATGVDLGRCLTMLGRYEEAERVLADALTVLTGTFGEADGRTARARALLDDLDKVRGAAGKARAPGG